MKFKNVFIFPQATEWKYFVSIFSYTHTHFLIGLHILDKAMKNIIITLTSVSPVVKCP